MGIMLELLADEDVWAEFNGQVIEEERGAMAGVPVSAFMADIYLDSLDGELEKIGFCSSDIRMT